MKETKCNECGLTGDFAGYHQVGDKKISLCVACAEKEVEVYNIAIPGESGFIEKTISSAMIAIESLVSAMDIDDEPYMIRKVKMSMVAIESLEEFKGF